MTTAPEYAQGGIIERRDGDLPAWILEHDCGPMLAASEIRRIGGMTLERLRRLNEARDDNCA